jgi:HK97 gp10 family phage protein
MEGLNSLLRKLDKIGGNSELALKKSITKATKQVQGDAKDLCPNDTGALKNSIQSSVKVKDEAIIGKVSTGKEYASYVEFGTGQKGSNSSIPAKDEINLSYREDWTGIAPQPFLYPALKQNVDMAKKMVISELKKEIRKVAKR